MGTDYEVGLRAYYFLNACRAWRHNPAWMTVLADTVATSSDEFGLKYNAPTTSKTTSVVGNKAAKVRKKILTKTDMKRLESHLTRVVERFKERDPDESCVFLENFMTHLKFDATDRRIAEFLFLSSKGAFRPFFEKFGSEQLQPSTPEIISAFLGETREEIQSRLNSSSPLLNCDIVYRLEEDDEGDAVDESVPYLLHPHILDDMENGRFDVGATVHRLLGNSMPSEAVWDDFAHIKADAEFAANIIRGALRGEGTKGVNILIHADVGVDTTEFCKALVAQVGVPLYAADRRAEPKDAAFEAGDVDLTTSFGRLEDKWLLDNLLGRCQVKAVALYEKADGLLAEADKKTSGFIMGETAASALMTENSAPCLWTTDSIKNFSPAALKPFSFVIEVKPPNAEVRHRIMMRTLKRYGVELTSGETRALAENYALPEAFFDQAVRAASLAVANGGARVRT